MAQSKTWRSGFLWASNEYCLRGSSAPTVSTVAKIFCSLDRGREWRRL
jgi:hypothetical protein